MTETTGQSSTGTSAQSVRDELSQDASRLTQTATQRAEQAADGGKKQATTAAHAASSAIEKAAGALRQDDKAPEWLANAFEKTARQIDDLARTIEGKDIKEIRRGVSQFARQNPLAFLAASAAAGFAAARFAPRRELLGAHDLPAASQQHREQDIHGGRVESMDRRANPEGAEDIPWRRRSCPG